MTVVVQRSIDIDAPAETVWAVLHDVEHWPDWTASMASVRRSRTGRLEVGEHVLVSQPGLPTLTYTITELEDGRLFTWEAGNVASRGGGEHVLTPRVGGACTATLRMTQRGPAAWLVGLALDRLTRRYLRLEAEGLKARSESDLRTPDVH